MKTLTYLFVALVTEIDWTLNTSLKALCSFQIALIVFRIFQIILKVSRWFSLNVFWLQRMVELVLIVVRRSKWNKNEFWFFQIVIDKLRQFWLLLFWCWKAIFFFSCVLTGQTFYLKSIKVVDKLFLYSSWGLYRSRIERYYVFQRSWVYVVLMMKFFLI